MRSRCGTRVLYNRISRSNGKHDQRIMRPAARSSPYRYRALPASTSQAGVLAAAVWPRICHDRGPEVPVAARSLREGEGDRFLRHAWAMGLRGICPGPTRPNAKRCFFAGNYGGPTVPGECVHRLRGIQLDRAGRPGALPRGRPSRGQPGGRWSRRDEDKTKPWTSSSPTSSQRPDLQRHQTKINS